MRVNSPPAVFCAAASWFAVTIAAGQTIAPPRISDGSSTDRPPVAQLPSLQRVLKQFDFEEAERFNLAFPEHFFRVNAPDQGFPPFGRMGFSENQAASGRWSFEFELGGGSMSARIPTGVLPVLPYADYMITASVRTHGLIHSRARVVAWLLDGQGQAIDSSRGQSQLVISEQRWDSVTVEVHGDHPGASHLVFELQVLQPRQFDAQAPKADTPQIEDIAGQVWFDDVVVSHLPRLDLSMPQAGNVVVVPEQPRLTMVLSELSSEQLTAKLEVIDLDGRRVFSDEFPAPRGRQQASVDLPVKRCGWYRAVLDILSRGRIARRQTLDFVIIPTPDAPAKPGAHAHGAPGTLLGVHLPSTSTEDLPLLPMMVGRLEADAAVLPIWNDHLTLQSAPQRLAAMRGVIEHMLQKHVDLVFALDRVPQELARSMALDSTGVFEMLRGDSRAWRPYLDELLVNFGLEISRWQIGDPRQPMSIAPEQLPQAVDAATRSLVDFVPDPSITVPWPLDRVPDPDDAVPSISIWIPHHVPPSSLGDYTHAPQSTDEVRGDSIMALLEQLPPSQYSSRQRLVDLMQRGLYAWREGFDMVAIEAPWSHDSQGRNRVMPDPAFVAWRSLAHELQGRTYAGELPVAQGVHCWFLRGDGARGSALVAWTDQALGSQPATLRVQLALDDVSVADACGNIQRISARDGMHEIPLDETPVFIRNVALELVQFRGEFAIDPDFVPAAARVHEHTIILRNPWDVAVSGTIRLPNDDQWQLTPSVQDFVMPARGEVKLPLNIIPQRSITAGHKTVYADVTLNADRTYNLRVQTQVDVGLKNIDLAASWVASPNPQTGKTDLLITNVVSNKGDQVMNLDVYMLAPGVSQNRRTIARLGPGETAVRSFRIPNGMAVLAGQSIRVGVEERDGVARLNRVLNITTDELPMQSSANR